MAREMRLLRMPVPDPGYRILRSFLGVRERLNAIEGLCTVQSCTGHTDAEGFRSSGHLWLKLSAPMMREFIDSACELAANDDCIERVGLTFTPNCSYAVVEFAGMERGKLGESMTAIVDYFRELSLSLVWRDAN